MMQAKRRMAQKKMPAVVLQQIEPVTETIKRFPSTRYYGSKRKLLNWMYPHLAGLRFETALDAFGGSGSRGHASNLRSYRQNTLCLVNTDYGPMSKADR